LSKHGLVDALIVLFEGVYTRTSQLVREMS